MKELKERAGRRKANIKINSKEEFGGKTSRGSSDSSNRRKFNKRTNKRHKDLKEWKCKQLIHMQKRIIHVFVSQEKSFSVGRATIPKNIITSDRKGERDRESEVRKKPYTDEK